MRTVPAMPATGYVGRFEWPYASRPGGAQYPFEVGRQVVGSLFGLDITVPIERVVQCVAMPHDWDTRGSRTIAETASHELGHNFGLQDQYSSSTHSTDAKARDIGSWSLMSYEKAAPEPTVPEKMLLGWVKPSEVKTLSFAVAGHVDEDVVLHAAEHGPVPFGRAATAEIRIADRKNYYFE